MKAFIRQHPTASYFVLAFALSWGGIMAVVRGGAIPAPPDEAQRLFTAVYLAMLAGPSVAGLTITWITGGSAGLRAFRDRLFRWRVSLRWYAVALLTAPLALVGALLLLAGFPGEFVPNLQKLGPDGPIVAQSRIAFLLMGLVVGAGAGFFEELGWTGTALPRLRARHGVLVSGLALGVVWGAWHFLAILWGSASAFETVPIAIYLAIALFSFLPPYRVLMVWVYGKTGSLLVAVLMHMSLTASMLILGPAVVGRGVMTFDLVFAAVLWALAGIVVVTVSPDHERLRPTRLDSPPHVGGRGRDHAGVRGFGGGVRAQPGG